MKRRLFPLHTFLLTLLLLTACGAKPPQQVEYLPTASSNQAAVPTVASAPTTIPTNASSSTAQSASGTFTIDFSAETVGAAPTTFVPAVGYWIVGVDGDNPVLVVDGRQWSKGQPPANIAEQARALYGDKYAEFLDSVQAYAYYPFVVAKDVENFTDGEISVRFKPLVGNIDQNGGIVFGLQPNGDYYTIRASALEENLILWQVVQGQRSSLEWIRNTPTATGQWHELKVVINGTKVEGYLDGQLYLTHTFDAPLNGRVGLWSKADSTVYFDDFTVTPR
ncbi:MAG: hypothetical protein KDD72_00210 [Anaerolineales bacterium]|nr:hypothetical protein [Anaerolineales bacterium]